MPRVIHKCPSRMPRRAENDKLLIRPEPEADINSIMMRAVIILISELLACISCSFADCARVKALAPEASELRGLPLLKNVACEELGKTQYEKLKVTQFGNAGPGNSLREEETLYKAIGMIPENYTYSDCIRKSSTHDTLPFYSPEKHMIILPDWRESPDDILIHELTHAIQDQHFSLLSLQVNNVNSLDSYLGIASLIEGDASLIQDDFNSSHTKAESVLSATDYELDPQCALPENLVNLFDFPYGFGKIFVERQKTRGSLARLNAAFHNPPRSSQEIMLSDAYNPVAQTQFRARKIELPLSIPADKASLSYSDTLGQYGIRLILAGLGNKERAILTAKGWRGDRIGLYHSKDSNSFTILWKSTWESCQKARDFFAALQQLYALRKNTSFNQGTSYFTYTGEAGYSISLRLSGVNVYLYQSQVSD